MINSLLEKNEIYPYVACLIWHKSTKKEHPKKTEFSKLADFYQSRYGKHPSSPSPTISDLSLKLTIPASKMSRSTCTASFSVRQRHCNIEEEKSMENKPFRWETKNQMPRQM